MTTSALFTMSIHGWNWMMFVMYDNSAANLQWKDISAAGAGTVVHSLGVGGDDEIATLEFNNYLMYFSELNLQPSAFPGPQYWNGTAWGNLAYTGWGTDVPFGGAVYKNRAYFLVRGQAAYYYSGIASIAGAVTKVSLDQIVSSKSSLYAIASVSLSEGIQQENVLAFIFQSGEVLVYSGDYPNAANWQIIGRFQIPRPLYYHSTINVLGDTYVITESALISMRTLFQQGQQFAIKEAPSNAISKRWKQIFPQYFNSYGLKGLYDDVQNRIVICIPGVVDYDGAKADLGALRLVYSLDNGAWFEFYADGVPRLYCATFYKGDVYYGLSLDVVVMKSEGTTNFVDDTYNGSTASIRAQLRTAPLPADKFGVSRVTGIELIMQSDAYGLMGYTLIGNLGQRQTTSQLIPSPGTGVSNVLLNSGIDSNYVQLDITGNTNSSMSVGFELLAMNVWVDQGGVR